MAIKGLKEALAKKKAKHHPETQDEEIDVNVKPVAPKAKPVSMKPQKKVTGRGR